MTAQAHRDSLGLNHALTLNDCVSILGLLYQLNYCTDVYVLSDTLAHQ
jgi:hypothetical protein